MSAFNQFMFGTPGKTEKLTTLDPAQSKFLQNMFAMLGGGQVGQGFQQSQQYLMDLLDPSSDVYKKFEEPYMKQFEQEIVPGIAERFAGASPMGGGALSSSGFGQSLSAAGGQLQSQLASMKEGLRNQAVQGLMNQYNQMAGLGMGVQPFGYQYQQASPGLFQNLAGGAAQGLMSYGLGKWG